jgi:hypothetical protein
MAGLQVASTGTHRSLDADEVAVERAVVREPGLSDVVLGLDVVADHLQDAIDQLGARSSGLSMGAAARRLEEVLPTLSAATPEDATARVPMPPHVRSARARLRDAAMRLPELSRAMLGVVPPALEEQSRADLELCRWVDAARLIATWMDEVALR